MNNIFFLPELCEIVALWLFLFNFWKLQNIWNVSHHLAKCSKCIFNAFSGNLVNNRRNPFIPSNPCWKTLFYDLSLKCPCLYVIETTNYRWFALVIFNLSKTVLLKTITIQFIELWTSDPLNVSIDTLIGAKKGTTQKKLGHSALKNRTFYLWIKIKRSCKPLLNVRSNHLKNLN